MCFLSLTLTLWAPLIQCFLLNHGTLSDRWQRQHKFKEIERKDIFRGATLINLSFDLFVQRIASFSFNHYIGVGVGVRERHFHGKSPFPLPCSAGHCY